MTQEIRKKYDDGFLGFVNTPVRFFIYDEDIEDSSTGAGLRECDESEFLQAPGIIEYERHSVYANGVKQICLTKNALAL